VTEAYEHGMAVRAVMYLDGETVAAPETFRLLSRGGRYAVIGGFEVCTTQPGTNSEKVTRIPGVQ
jgi:hypothetical protein